MSQEDFEQMLLMTLQNVEGYTQTSMDLEAFTFDLLLEYLQGKYVEDAQL
jgi:hypothetical protein